MLYRARITVPYSGGLCRALVPQLFGDQPVTITRFASETPTLPVMGWVAFEGDGYSYPVWMGGLSSGGSTDDGDGDGGGSSIFITRGYRWVNQVTATDPGNGKVKANNLDPALATQVYISAHDQSDEAFITLLSLKAGDLFAVYISGDITTRIEYTLTGPAVNNTEWLTVPVSVGANHGFAPGIPGNNASVKVTVQTVGSGGGGGVIGVVSYVHVQTTVTAVWVIPHNLGWFPNVTVFDSAGTGVEGDIVHVNANQLTISFSGAFSGKAYLS